MSNQALPRPRFSAPEPEHGPLKHGTRAALKIEARTTPLLDGKVSEVPDVAFGWAMRLCGVAVVALLGLIVYQLVVGSALSWHAFGWKFFGQSDWNPVEDQYGALPFIFGTIVSSLLALVIAVPLSIGVAVFITEMCPIRLRGILSFTTELLAAIPSVVYGLWAIFVLVPVIREYVEPFLAKTLGWTTLFSGPPYGIGMLAAGVILAIMVIPIISSITREVLIVVPQHQREAVLALGATRWEMIRMGVLRNARAGIVGAIILGLGRALGETMAVTMVIGNDPSIHASLLAPGYSIAAVIANEFSEAGGAIYPAALIELGLVLFFLTIVINAAARIMIMATTSKGSKRA